MSNDSTIHEESPLGKHLKKEAHSESLFLIYEGKSVPIATEITIGRHKKSDIIIDDALVSRKHVIIKKINDEYFIKDLKSTNGTLLNNKLLPPKQFMQLHVEDIITIGSTELVIKRFF
jgi:pSer/pThr/pTyr-binding forkhead associated (FHA) protein